MKRKIFLDTEFNGFGGVLLSMGMIDEDGKEFYEAITFGPRGRNEPMDPWALEHVIPVIKKQPVHYTEFQRKLQEYLSGEFVVIADWPDDLRYFCESLITAPGQMMAVSSFDMIMDRRLSSSLSLTPHNALADAKAIKDSWCQLQEAA